MEITNRRALLISGVAVIGGMGMGNTSTCSTATLDPAKIANDIKVACGIAVVAATVAQIINAGVGMSAEAIISLVCSSFKNAQVASGKLGAGLEVNFVVHVCDTNGACKSIPVTAKTQ